MSIGSFWPELSMLPPWWHCGSALPCSAHRRCYRGLGVSGWSPRPCAGFPRWGLQLDPQCWDAVAPLPLPPIPATDIADLVNELLGWFFYWKKLRTCWDSWEIQRGWKQTLDVNPLNQMYENLSAGHHKVVVKRDWKNVVQLKEKREAGISSQLKSHSCIVMYVDSMLPVPPCHCSCNSSLACSRFPGLSHSF